eukprot:CAMPEP_0206544088 /NCGR_PEP_ID=MMETSP0325_2-20121206/11305_1 /ASSEMBLY_ACC=CAM_ASM_000347 /TAXON_ID=2866 /ORGANISM="Crypthecodinium cohnii, Strain Seligo" /LENGTH=259 /DNA_ID=CAMNT_0054042761 /DNA_START=129 /DNA_END=905 /DNA_ORIENTATION=+
MTTRTMQEFSTAETEEEGLLRHERPQNQQQGVGIKFASSEIRRDFVQKVYALLSLQIFLTVAVAAYIFEVGQSTGWLRSHEWLMWLSVVATIGSACAMSCCGEELRRYPTNYIFLFTFTLFEAIMIGFVSTAFTWQSVLLAASMTALVFVGLMVYAWNSSIDFTGYGPYLFATLLTCSMFGLTLSIFPAFGVNVDIGIALYDCLGILVFSFAVIFDTQLMLGEWGGHKLSFSVDDYVFAALNMYLDIINIFLHLLSLLG